MKKTLPSNHPHLQMHKYNLDETKKKLQLLANKEDIKRGST